MRMNDTDLSFVRHITTQQEAKEELREDNATPLRGADNIRALNDAYDASVANAIDAIEHGKLKRWDYINRDKGITENIILVVVGALASIPFIAICKYTDPSSFVNVFSATIGLAIAIATALMIAYLLFDIIRSWTIYDEKYTRQAVHEQLDLLRRVVDVIAQCDDPVIDEFVETDDTCDVIDYIADNYDYVSSVITFDDNWFKTLIENELENKQLELQAQQEIAERIKNA